jgi:hypothetical protein
MPNKRTSLHHSQRLARLIALFKPLPKPAATGTDLYWCGLWVIFVKSNQFGLFAIFTKPYQIRS